MTNPTCNTCNTQLKRGKDNRLYCPACAETKGRASRRKGNEGQREACNLLKEHGLDCVVSGIGQRRAHDKGVPDLTVTVPCRRCDGSGLLKDRPLNVHGRIPVCPTCKGQGHTTLHGEVKYHASLPAWLWGRGPQRKPAQWMRDVLEGVRCGNCIGNGWIYNDEIDIAGKPTDTLTCPDCHGTGWLSHTHDFLMIRKTGGRPKYDWRALLLYSHWSVDVKDTDKTIDHPGPEQHEPIVIYPATDWARAVVKGAKNENY